MAEDDSMFSPTPMGPPDSFAPVAPEGDDAKGALDTKNEINKEIAGARSNIESIGKENERLTEIYAEREKALDPLRNKQIAAIDAMQELAKQRPQFREPPPVPQRGDPQDEMTWLSAAAMIGGLAGAFTRNHATNALAAFSGAIQGYNEGNKQKFDENIKIWEAESKNASEYNTRAQREYLDIMQNSKLNIDQMSAEIELVATKYNDQAALTAARSKNFDTMAKLHDQNIKWIEAGDKAAQNYKQKIMENDAAAYVQSQAGQQRIRNIIAGKEPPPPTVNRNTPLGVRDAAVMDAVRLQAPGFDAGQYLANQRERMRRFSLYSVADERQVQNQGTAINHLDQLEKLHTALGNGDVNALNAVKQMAQQELGIPAPTNFDGARQLIGNEIVKAIVNNGGGVTDRTETAANLSRVRSPQQMHELIHTYQMLIAAQMAAKKRQYEFSREGTTGAPKFEAAGHLTPKHLQLMDEAERSFTQGVNPERTDPGVALAQKSDLQRNLDAIFGSTDKAVMGAAGSVAGTVAGDISKPNEGGPHGEPSERMKEIRRRAHANDPFVDFYNWINSGGTVREVQP